jgi:hypothetical protein
MCVFNFSQLFTLNLQKSISIDCKVFEDVTMKTEFD